ncbi:MAG: hypothetical protein ACE5DM_03915 [Candidatus Nanoarchaeia archaeon]
MVKRKVKNVRVSKKSAGKKVMKKVAKKASGKKTKKISKNSKNKQATEPGIDRFIRKAAYAGMASLFLSLLVAYISSFESYFDVVRFIFITVLATIFSVWYMLGYARLGKKAHLPWLRNASYAIIVLTVIDVLILIFMSIAKMPQNKVVSTGIIMMYGVLAIAFGIGVYGLRRKLGRFARVTGILNILGGVLMISIVFVGLGVLLVLFTEILNITVLFKGARW